MDTNHGTDSSKPKDNDEINKRLQAFLLANQLSNDTPTQKPLLASELDIMSSFKVHGTHFFINRKGARSTDHRIWTEV